MIVLERHDFILRGGPLDGEERVFPPVSAGVTSVSYPCGETHEEHAGAVSTIAPLDAVHAHTYLFSSDHPDELMFASTEYRQAKTPRKTLFIPHIARP